jgi:hypothetical protein
VWCSVTITRILAQTPSLKNPYKMDALLLASFVVNRRSQNSVMFTRETLHSFLLPIIQILSSEFLRHT